MKVIRKSISLLLSVLLLLSAFSGVLLAQARVSYGSCGKFVGYELSESGVERISSKELGAQLGLTPSQIRQDFSCFGEFGQQGYGYNVLALREQIAGILPCSSGQMTIAHFAP